MRTSTCQPSDSQATQKMAARTRWKARAITGPDVAAGAKVQPLPGPLTGAAAVRSPVEEHRAVGVAEDVLGGAAEHHLDDPPVPVGADEEQVVAALADEVGDPLRR